MLFEKYETWSRTHILIFKNCLKPCHNKEKTITPQGRPAACKVKRMMRHMLPQLTQRAICMIGLWVLFCKKVNWGWQWWLVVKKRWQDSNAGLSGFRVPTLQPKLFFIPLTHIYLTLFILFSSLSISSLSRVLLATLNWATPEKL